MNLSDRNPRREGVAQGRPWQSRSEYLVDQALASWFAEDDALRNLPPVALPPTVRPDYGRRAWTIHDVLNVDRYAATNRSWTSGFPNATQKRTEDAVAREMFSGSSRFNMGPMT